MKIYKYEYKEKNLITLINNEKKYCDNPIFAIKDFECHVPTLIFNTDEMIYEYDKGFKYYFKNNLVYANDEKSKLLDDIIDSIDVYIEKKNIRDKELEITGDYLNKIP